MRSLRILAAVVARRPGDDRVLPRPDFAAPVGPRAELGHAGRWLTDEWGRVVNLHGVNFVKKFPPISPAAAGFGEDDAAVPARPGLQRRAARRGVRLGDARARRHRPGLRRLDRVDGARARPREHLHAGGLPPGRLRTAVHGNGFPEWATLTDGLPNPNDPFPTYYLTNPAMQRAFDNFWLNKPGPDGVPLQTHYAEAVRSVAAAVHDEDYVLGYDTFNEPWPGSVFDTVPRARLSRHRGGPTRAVQPAHDRGDPIRRPQPLRVQRAVHALQLRARGHVALGHRRAARRALVPRLRGHGRRRRGGDGPRDRCVDAWRRAPRHRVRRHHRHGHPAPPDRAVRRPAHPVDLLVLRREPGPRHHAGPDRDERAGVDARRAGPPEPHGHQRHARRARRSTPPPAPTTTRTAPATPTARRRTRSTGRASCCRAGSTRAATRSPSTARRCTAAPPRSRCTTTRRPPTSTSMSPAADPAAARSSPERRRLRSRSGLAKWQPASGSRWARASSVSSWWRSAHRRGSARSPRSAASSRSSSRLYTIWILAGRLSVVRVDEGLANGRWVYHAQQSLHLPTEVISRTG